MQVAVIFFLCYNVHSIRKEEIKLNNISFSDLLGKTILIGLTYYTADNEFIEQKQHWGTVIESNENQIFNKDCASR